MALTHQMARVHLGLTACLQATSGHPTQLLITRSLYRLNPALLPGGSIRPCAAACPSLPSAFSFHFQVSQEVSAEIKTENTLTAVASFGEGWAFLTWTRQR